MLTHYSGQLLNFACFHNTRANEWDKDDWNSPITIEDVLETCEGFHPTWLEVIKKADSMKVYTVTQRPPSPQIVRGKVVVIGDAAHHMLPTHAQGGCQGVESAAALGTLFSDLPSNFRPSDLENRLRIFQQLRLPRSAATQILSSLNPQLNQTAKEEKLAEIKRFYQGPLYNINAQPWSEPIRDFFYAYDVFEEAERAKQFVGKEDGIPEGAVEYFGRDIVSQ